MKRLWLIDDDPIFRYVVRHLVKSNNLVDDFIEFENGELGWSELNRIHLKQRPNLILLDINMPVLNGWGFLDKLTSMQNDCLQTKILLISSSVAESDQKKSKQYPLLQGFINKPISESDICALLQPSE